MHKWTSALEGIEAIAVEEWSQRLAGLTGEQIKHGLTAWDSDWPPSADEFRACCTGKGLNEFGLTYTPECYRVSPEMDKSRLLSSDDRDQRREDGKSKIKDIRESLGR